MSRKQDWIPFFTSAARQFGWTHDNILDLTPRILISYLERQQEDYVPSAMTSDMSGLMDAFNARRQLEN